MDGMPPEDDWDGKRHVTSRLGLVLAGKSWLPSVVAAALLYVGDLRMVLSHPVAAGMAKVPSLVASRDLLGSLVTVTSFDFQFHFQ